MWCSVSVCPSRSWQHHPCISFFFFNVEMMVLSRSIHCLENGLIIHSIHNTILCCILLNKVMRVVFSSYDQRIKGKVGHYRSSLTKPVLSNLLLKIFLSEDSTTSLGSLFQCWPNIIVTKSFLIANLNFL